MVIEDFQNETQNVVVLSQISSQNWKITSDANFINGNQIPVFLEHKNEKWYLTDNKETLKYMNDLYELKSADVKMCITNILKIYGFSINSGILQTEITHSQNFVGTYFNFIMCISQLANMFAFFDKP